MIYRKIAMHALFFAVLVFVTAPALAYGAIFPGPIVECTGALPKETACTICDLLQVIQNVINFGIFLYVFGSAIFFSWAGIRYVTSAWTENPENSIKSARSLFKSILTMLIVMIFAWVAVDTLMKTFTDGKIGPWNQICRNK